MLKNTLKTIALLGLLTGLLTFQVAAKPLFTSIGTAFNTPSLTDLSTDGLPINGMAIKRGEPYDAKKDPALRKGTENEEMPQGSFFAIPALVIGIMLAFLFFNRD